GFRAGIITTVLRTLLFFWEAPKLWAKRCDRLTPETRLQAFECREFDQRSLLNWLPSLQVCLFLLATSFGILALALLFQNDFILQPKFLSDSLPSLFATLAFLATFSSRLVER